MGHVNGSQLIHFHILKSVYKQTVKYLSQHKPNYAYKRLGSHSDAGKQSKNRTIYKLT
jgi:hypothetical protein